MNVTFYPDEELGPEYRNFEETHTLIGVVVGRFATHSPLVEEVLEMISKPSEQAGDRAASTRQF